MNDSPTPQATLDVDTDLITGDLQVALIHHHDNGYGDIHHLAGPPHTGDSVPLVQHELTAADAAVIRAVLDAVYPTARADNELTAEIRRRMEEYNAAVATDRAYRDTHPRAIEAPELVVAAGNLKYNAPAYIAHLLAEVDRLAADVRWEQTMRRRVQDRLRQSEADNTAMILHREAIRDILAAEPAGTVAPAAAQTWAHLKRAILAVLDGPADGGSDV